MPSDLAERLDVSRPTVIAIETGKCDPSLPLVFMMAKVFAMTIEEIPARIRLANRRHAMARFEFRFWNLPRCPIPPPL